MKSGRIFLAALGVAVLAVAAPGQSQSRRPLSPLDRSKYLVSVNQAGTVNAVDGDANFKRTGKWDMLITGDDLQDGDTVKTGSDGRVEILLNPGSYLRVAENSEVQFYKDPTRDLSIDVLSGSIIVEASIVDGYRELIATVVTPRGSVEIARGGIYRFNVAANGDSEALVYKGRLVLAGKLLKEGYGATIDDGSALLISAFDKHAQDGFDLWSRDRANVLVAANKRLSKQALLRNAQYNTWYYNPFAMCFTYLPFSRSTSPYGGGYSNCFTNNHPSYSGPFAGSNNSNTGWSPSTSSMPTYSGTSSSSSTISTPAPSSNSSSSGLGSTSSGTITRGKP
ncbi:MAG TPA: FecR domain-containing protein [Blastocatellia bacterium]|nr:FecR domain-containing protein [Blastocatellia bacterium]